MRMQEAGSDFPRSHSTSRAPLCTLRRVPRSSAKPAVLGIVFAPGVALGAKVSPWVPRQAPPSMPKGVQVYFSPRGGCTKAIVRQLDAAKNTALVQAYSFTSAPIAKALVNASKSGVKVQVIADGGRRDEQYAEADSLAHSKVPTFVDAKHKIAHDKVMIIDGQIVITGSFNFTKGREENNAENLLVIHDPELAAHYTENWKKHYAHAETYPGR
jgi:phosphatidylserine/phosphatidylglycerophosphate/cardiolipin synthase-like enzyme